MSDYIPTTDEVRERFSLDAKYGDPVFEDSLRAEFDRWLAQHDAEIMQQAYSLAGKLADSFLDSVRADERARGGEQE